MRYDPRVPWLVVFLIAFALRVANVVLLADTPLYLTPHGDGRVYLEWADAIRAGGIAGLFESGEVFYQAPLYPHLLALFRAVFGESLLALRIGQAALGAGTAVLIGLATARMVGRRAGIAAALLIAVYSTSIWLDGLVQKSVLAGSLVAAVLLASTFDRRRGRFVLGLVVGLLMLTRGEARLLALVLGAWLISARRVDRVVAYSVGLAVVLLPVLVRNVVVAGEAVLTTSQAGTNLYIGNASGSNGAYVPLVSGRGDARFEAEDARRLAEGAAGGPLDAGEVSAYWRDRALNDMAANPPKAAMRFARKGTLALSRTELADTDDLRHAASTSIVLKLGPGFALLLGLAAAGIVVAGRSERQALRVPALLGATQWFALVLFFVSARYRLPLALALTPLAGLALASWPRVRERRAACALAFLGALLVALLPLDIARPERGRAAALVNEGYILADLGQHTAAETCAVEAVELTPEFFDAQRLHALTLLRQDRREAALAPLEIAHLLAPDDWQVRAWLGIALGESGELRRAHELLLPAALERPEALPIVSNAAALAVTLGDHAGALEVLRARLAAEPAAGARPFRLQLAWLLATSRDDSLRDGVEALRTLEPLDDAADVLDVRAAAFAEMGQFKEAIADMERALEQAAPPTEAMRKHRASYVARRPWRT